jgi:AraC-like DNA-binding protein
VDGVAHKRDGAGVVRSLHVPWRPAAALSPFVRAMTAYDLILDRPGAHRGLPSTSLTLVLPVEQPLDVAWSGHPDTRARNWSTVSGLHTRPAEIRHEGRLAGIQLALTPRGARVLFGVPAAELAGVLTELGPVAAPLADLPGRLADAATWRERLTLVESRLRQVVARAPDTGPRPELGWALRRLSRASTVRSVADEVGLSRRHLGAVFLAEYGVTPKQYQRIARFNASSRELTRQVRCGRPSLALLAAACGFADQAHLTREWTALAGCSPTAWLREEFPFLQDDTVDAAIA